MGLSRRSFLRRSGLALAATALPAAELFARISSSVRPDVSDAGHRIQREAFTMGSIVTVTAFHPDIVEANRAIDAAFAEMKTIDGLMSVYKEDSQISRVNRDGHRGPVPVDARITEIISNAQRFNELTAKSFDITVEPLMELYGFRDDSAEHPFPTDAEISHALEGVGMRNIECDPASGTLALHHPSTRLDLGGIAVGYALDRVAAILRRAGIRSAIINHSGDIYAIGSQPGKQGWDVEIVDPLKPDSTITEVSICDQALSTSGNYENTVSAGGRTIGHILDPRTAKTAAAFLSTTIIAPNAITADALSTGVFAFGDATAGMLKSASASKCIGITPAGNGERVSIITA